MCRFIIYKGRALYIEEVLIIPNNSMLVQSRCATYHPGVYDPKEYRNIRVNGDGFGVAWYCDDTYEIGSCVMKFMTPAWSSSNLKSVACHVKAPLIMGHVRAASSGHNPLEKTIVSYENCHPFQFGRYTFMHNGSIPDFFKIKRPLCALVRDEFFHNITGNTDSEHIFSLLLQLLVPEGSSCSIEGADAFMEDDPLQSVDVMADAVQRTIEVLLELMESNGVNKACSLNLVLTDGCNIVATRFRNCPESDAPSLYYTASPLDLYVSRIRTPSMQKIASSECLASYDATPKSPEIRTGCNFVSPTSPLERRAISSFIVASEPQTVDEVCECLRIASNSTKEITDGEIPIFVDSKWHLIPNRHMMLCSGSRTNLEEINLLECRPIKLAREPCHAVCEHQA